MSNYLIRHCFSKVQVDFGLQNLSEKLIVLNGLWTLLVYCPIERPKSNLYIAILIIFMSKVQFDFDEAMF
jgi:hypothetical protein